MPRKNENLEYFIEDSDSMEMKEDEPDLSLLEKTQYEGPGAEISDEQREEIAYKKQLAKKFGSNVENFKWLVLNDETKLEKIKEFDNGGFAGVTLHKFRRNGKMIIVKKNRMTGKNDDAIKADTVNEIRHMNMVKSDFVIRCYGYSEIHTCHHLESICREFEKCKNYIELCEPSVQNTENKE